MVLLIANGQATTNQGTTLSTTIEIDLSISVVSKVTLNNSNINTNNSTSNKKEENINIEKEHNTNSEILKKDDHSIINSPIKKSERLLAKNNTNLNSIERIEERVCQWRDCSSSFVSYPNILDHIQNVHVAPQTKIKGYICLWEGCKVFNRPSSSHSWIERHVLSHGGNKPYACIFPRCGLSFASQGALERHVNSHISTSSTNGNSVSLTIQSSSTNSVSSSTHHNKKSEHNHHSTNSPSKSSSRRKKIKSKRQKLNIGQFVDYFDKRTIEIIKYRLSTLSNQNFHNCLFTSQVLSKRLCTGEEPHFLVRWFPRFILSDEWIPQSKYTIDRIIPFHQIPVDRLHLIWPNLVPPERKTKAKRKWKQEEQEHVQTKKKNEEIGLKKGIKESKETCSWNVPLDPEFEEFLTL